MLSTGAPVLVGWITVITISRPLNIMIISWYDVAFYYGTHFPCVLKGVWYRYCISCNIWGCVFSADPFCSLRWWEYLTSNNNPHLIMIHWPLLRCRMFYRVHMAKNVLCLVSWCLITYACLPTIIHLCKSQDNTKQTNHRTITYMIIRVCSNF